MVSIGYFRRDKGIESTLFALWKLKHRGLSFYYTIAGGPQRQFAGQEEYQREIDELICVLQLQDTVHTADRYLSLAEQIEVIQQSHAGMFAYQNPEQASSGTMPLILACGRPVISTPFEYAIAKRSEGIDVKVAQNYGAESLADSIADFAKRLNAFPEICAGVYERTRKWTWEHIGARYLDELIYAARHARG